MIAPTVAPPPSNEPRRRREQLDPEDFSRHRAIVQARLSSEVVADPEPPTDEERAWLDAHRPRTRADCSKFGRPCPFVGCRHSNVLEVSPRTGAIELNLDVAPENSCSLDVAERDANTLEQIAQCFDVTKERIRQLETKALSHTALAARAARIRPEHLPAVGEATNTWE